MASRGTLVLMDALYLFVRRGSEVSFEVVHQIGPADHQTILCVHGNLRGAVAAPFHPLLSGTRATSHRHYDTVDND